MLSTPALQSLEHGLKVANTEPKMEPCQKELLRKNLTELIKKTDCNEILLAELERLNVLARIDLNEIVSGTTKNKNNK